ncbi:MAG: NADH-quinone oxidoreductase subunit I [Planctomycetota bacterium]|nr:NADH-quinone oxidoreductase subunit I [Planctomycetota bacterium]
MTVTVKPVRRRKATFLDRLYLPAILKGLSITFKRMFRPKITMQFPEERWTVRDQYRGMPVLVSDDEGRPKCVACSLCEFVCPPKAIFIVPEELEVGNKVERGPAVFDLNMLRCIYCALCEEACPEEAIFMSKNYMVWGANRSDMLFHKEKLYELGGIRTEGVKKWKDK